MSSTLRLHRILGPAIRLSSDVTTGERHPIWIQGAVEGIWRGHPSHPKIEFTAAVFDEIVRNFRASPAYRTDASGVGCAECVRLDYEHISEMAPKDVPKITEQGVPAPGFIYEVETRRGSAGKVELWMLVEMGESLWGQVSRKEQLWTSVAVDPNGVDRETGKVIGHVLTSLAITNNPFILGMESLHESQRKSIESISGGRLAASMHGVCLFRDDSKPANDRALIACSMDVWGKAESVDQVLVSLRNRFGLNGDATASEILLELRLFEEMRNSGTRPTGGDFDWVVSSIKDLFGMKLLTTDEEVIAQAIQAMGDLVEKEITDRGTVETPGHPANQSTGEQSPVGTSENPLMSTPKSLASRLAIALKLSADADEDTIVDRVKGLVNLRGGVVKRLSARKTSSKPGKARRVLFAASEEDEVKILEEVEGLVDDAETVEEKEELADIFEQLKEVLDAEEFVDVLTKATKLSESAKKYGGVVEELNALRAKFSDAEVKDAEKEVEAIAACHKLDGKTKSLMLSHVIKTEKSSDGKETKAVRMNALESLRKEWPLPEGQNPTLLTANLFAGKDGAQLGGTSTGLHLNQPLPPNQGGNDAQLVDLQSKIKLCAGNNDIEKTISFLEKSEPAVFGSMADHEKPFYASQFFKTGKLSA